MKKLQTGFEAAVRKLFDPSATKSSDAEHFGFDFLLSEDNRRIACEVKFYRTHNVPANVLRMAAAKLSADGRNANADESRLFVSSFVSWELRETIQSDYNVRVIDRSIISAIADFSPENGIQFDKYFLLGEAVGPEEIRTTVDTKRTEEARSLLPKNEVRPRASFAQMESEEATRFLNDLRCLRKGKTHWRSYEQLCENILKFLFDDQLKSWKRQHGTDDGSNRFDLICQMTRTEKTTAFWDFLQTNFQSRYVLFEFKNYSRKIKQPQILSTEKYLFAQSLRKAAIILSRSGADAGAHAVAKGALRENGKLILVVCDDHIKRMLEAKINGDEPSEILLEAADDFLMSIER